MFSISHSISWNMEHSQLMFNTSFFFVCVYVCVMHDHVSVGPCVPSGAHLCLCMRTLWFCVLSLVSNKDTKATLRELGRQLSSWELRFQRTHVRSSQRPIPAARRDQTPSSELCKQCTHMWHTITHTHVFNVLMFLKNTQEIVNSSEANCPLISAGPFPVTFTWEFNLRTLSLLYSA